ncbi:MAG: ribosomal protein S6--L-glutamate ligase [Cyclobacteriaceae bacterium]|jgi:ribosomal protein S6--L-glutamate ligase
MRIAILSRNKNLYSTRRLIEAGEARGHKVRVLDHLKCFMDITSEKPTLHYKDEEFGADDFDAVIPRIGASVTSFGTAVLRQFEMMGVYCINESVAISRSRDKLRSLQLLSRKKIGIPVTAYAHNTESIDGLIREVGGAPVVIKLLEGTHGIGVVLAENKKVASSIIEAFMGLNANILVQEFIKESKGSDVRCFVVGGMVIAAMERRAAPGEFRSNLHRGGTAQLVKLTAAERRTAIKAANTMGMNMCGVDILRSDRGPLIMEVNSSPGLEGIETATQKDVAGMIYEFIEKNAEPHKNKTKGRG